MKIKCKICIKHIVCFSIGILISSIIWEAADDLNLKDAFVGESLIGLSESDIIELLGPPFKVTSNEGKIEHYHLNQCFRFKVNTNPKCENQNIIQINPSQSELHRANLDGVESRNRCRPLMQRADGKKKLVSEITLLDYEPVN